MGCQDEMVEMESQGDRERRELLVGRDQLVHKVFAKHWRRAWFHVQFGINSMSFGESF